MTALVPGPSSPWWPPISTCTSRSTTCAPTWPKMQRVHADRAEQPARRLFGDHGIAAAPPGDAEGGTGSRARRPGQRTLSSQAKAEAQAHAEQLARQIQAEAGQGAAAGAVARSATCKQTATTANAKIADVSTDVGTVKTQVCGHQVGTAEDHRRPEDRARRSGRAERPDRHQRAGTCGAEAAGRAQLLRVQAGQDESSPSASATSPCC